MTSTTVERTRPDTWAASAVTGVGVLAMLWCLGFAAVNVAFELTGHFERGRLADDTPGITVMNWLVVGLKLIGAAVALLAIRPRQRVLKPATLTVLLWGAFATLATYVAGSLVEAAAIGTGVLGERSDISLRSVAYVALFLAGAAGFGVLATAHARGRTDARRLALLGCLAAPVVLGGVLLVAPLLLHAAGALPSA